MQFLRVFPLFALGCSIIFLVTVIMIFPDAAQGMIALEVDDCVKCHKKEPAAILSMGGKHKTAVTCLGCHVEHPPWGEDTIPACGKCHAGQSHFELDSCLACHADPHKPLELNLKDNITKPCLTCHDQQGKEMQEFKSRHAEQSCTFCHDIHGRVPDCSECHEPHMQGQKMNDCLWCHPAHHPLQIAPASTTPREFCVSCHDEIEELMVQTKTKHQNFTCAFCHRGPHPFIPQCQMCHGLPHASKMHEKMPNCLDCHMDPHNLMK